jgi:hypothetical protein
MENVDSMKAAKSLRNISRYTKMLRGGRINCIMKKRNNPTSSEIRRGGFFHPDIFGGIGMYHTKAHIKKKVKKFKPSPSTYFL